jgi:hypothetical protein
MGLASLVVGLGSQAAGALALKRTRKYFADKKAAKAKTTKAKAEKAADSYQPPAEKKEPGLGATESAIEKRRRRMREELHGTSK